MKINLLSYLTHKIVNFFILNKNLKTNFFQGDYTRTGERKFSGLMKDGMNSANR